MNEFELELKPLQRAALDQLAEGVIIADADGAILYVNRAAETLHGVSILGVKSDSYSETYQLFKLDGTPYPSQDLPLARTVRDGETVEDATWMIRRPDGTEVIALGTAKPVLSVDGARLGAVLTLRDNTAAVQHEADLQMALDVQKILLDEVNHRVANNLSLLVSLLRVQARQATGEETKMLLQQTQNRIAVMASIHSALYQTGQEGVVELAGHFRKMLGDIRDTYAAQNPIEISVLSEEPVFLAINRVIPLALSLNELVTNSLKYAFVDSDAGAITVEIKRDGDAHIIRYSDNGAGLPDGFALDKSSGLGMLILQTLSRQLNAELKHVPQERGTCFEISF